LCEEGFSNKDDYARFVETDHEMAEEKEMVEEKETQEEKEVAEEKEETSRLVGVKRPH
jgi:hypothetical protein